MPYPSQINPEGILTAARQLIEGEGAEHVSLHTLAGALGVGASALYRYYASKSELLRALNEATLLALIEAISEAVNAAPSAPLERARAMLLAYRAFAKANPAAYGLLFTNTLEAVQPDPALAESLALPLQAIMAELAGEEDSLAALRGCMSVAHGFVMLELSGQFRRGGNLDDAYARIVDAYLAGWK